ncbi:type II toxin-antitoxin system HicA family toxin [Nocardiopsis suaedae]|uniref:type II toxin-antitoxin system HicA family toxin n=1 Tax=Nocardiopsis suaedae TaxID=3018444 RepID=UPI0038CD876E
MPPLPTLTGKELIGILEKRGFGLAHVRGSHHIMKHPSGNRVAVPVHGQRAIPTGTLKGIMRQAGLTVHDLV